MVITVLKKIYFKITQDLSNLNIKNEYKLLFLVTIIYISIPHKVLLNLPLYLAVVKRLKRKNKKFSNNASFKKNCTLHEMMDV